MVTFSNSTYSVVAVPNGGTIKSAARVKPSDLILKSLIEAGAINGTVAASAPDPATFDWWLDDSTSPAVLKRYKSGAWVASVYDPFSGTPGLKFQFSDTTTMADPTAGYFRLNNATLSSVTALAISDILAETGAPDVAAFINAWQSGAQLILQDPVSPQNFAIYTVGAVTNNTDWSQVALTHVASAGSFVANQRYSVAYSASGPTGAAGADGADGADGVNAGLYFTFSTTTAMADPGAGIVRFNNATPASVTAIAIDDTSADAGNPDISAEIVSWDDSTATIKGRLILRDTGSPQNFHIYSLSGLTDNAGWSELAVTHIAGSGTFADADSLSLEFQRTGNNGADGAGVGDVVGPASATDGNITLFDGTTGKLIKDGPANNSTNWNTAYGWGDHSLVGYLVSSDLSGYLTSATAAATYQPLDSDLTSIAALTTTSFGRSTLEAANAAALATLAGVGTGDTPQFTGIEVGNATDTTLARSAAGEVSVEGKRLLNTGDLGLQTIVIPASAMILATTNGPASAQLESTTNKINYSVLDFDAATVEYAHFAIPFPKGWNESTITFRVFWRSTGSGTNAVVWQLQGVALSDGDSTDTAYGTAVTVTDAGQSSTTKMLVSTVSSAVTIAGTPAEGDMVMFRFARLATDGGDTLTTDAELIAVQLFYTVNALKDD